MESRRVFFVAHMEPTANHPIRKDNHLNQTSMTLGSSRESSRGGPVIFDFDGIYSPWKFHRIVLGKYVSFQNIPTRKCKNGTQKRVW